jgi:hypothetical protein
MKDPNTYSFANMYGSREEREKEAKKASQQYDNKAQSSYQKDNNIPFPLILPSPDEDEEKKWRRPIIPSFGSPFEMGLGGYSMGGMSPGVGGGMPYGMGGMGMPRMDYNPFAGQRPIMPQAYGNVSTVNVQYAAPDGTMYQMSATAPMQNRPYALGNLLMGVYALMTAEGKGYAGAGKGGSYAGGKGGGAGGGYSGSGGSSGGYAGGSSGGGGGK